MNHTEKKYDVAIMGLGL